MTSHSELLTIVLFSWLMILASALAFAMGKLFQGQKELTRQSHLSTLASFYAIAEARSFKSSTVLQRIVEVYKPTVQLTPEQQAAQVQAMNAGFNGLMDDATLFGAELATQRQSSGIPKWSKSDTDGDEIYDEDDIAPTDRERDLT